MTKLSPLRSRLADLRRRRQSVRWGNAYSALGLAILWTLFGAFLLDWAFELARWQRFVLLLVAGGVVVWAARRYTLPWLGHRESELDLALMVEQQQKIDSDLVAAIQFESPEAARWGSTQLEHAVIDYVAEFGKSWDVFEGFSAQQLVRRVGSLMATVALLGLVVTMAPGHARAFLNRFFLGSAHYPTKTIVQAVTINGQSLELVDGGGAIVKSPYGRPLKFLIHCAGEIPSDGRAELTTVNSRLHTTIELAQLRRDGEVTVFAGELPKLVDSLDFELYLGDAWTDPNRLQVIELPVVEPTLVATPPPYARLAEIPGETGGNSRQISVIEGSRVDLHLTSTNKRLASANLKIADKTYPLTELPFKEGEEPGRRWMLKADNSPLAQVQKPIRYEIQVVDEDGLQLEQPIQGFIRIKADQRPRITGHMVTRDVLPNARPRIEFEVMDDFGVRDLSLHLQSTRADESPGQEWTMPIRKLGKPILRGNLPLKDSYVLQLAPLKLVKGDQLKVTLQVTDYRGELTGQSAASEPFVLQVTDESGAMAVILKSDERSARQLDAINNRQLGIGGSK